MIQELDSKGFGDLEQRLRREGINSCASLKYPSTSLTNSRTDDQLSQYSFRRPPDYFDPLVLELSKEMGDLMWYPRGRLRFLRFRLLHIAIEHLRFERGRRMTPTSCRQDADSNFLTRREIESYLLEHMKGWLVHEHRTRRQRSVLNERGL